MGVRLSYCVNDEVVKLMSRSAAIRFHLALREKTFNRSKKGQLLYFGAVARGRVEGRVTRDESEGFRFRRRTDPSEALWRIRVSVLGAWVSGVGFQEKPLNLKPEH